MKRIELNDFLTYKALSRLTFSPSGTCAALVVTTPNVQSNSYDQNVWLYSEDVFRQITFSNHVGSYIWDGSDMLLYSDKPENEDEHSRTGEFTAYYRQNIHEAKKEWAFTLPVTAKSIRKVGSGLYAVTAYCDAAYPDYYKMSDEERADVETQKKQNSDYEIMDEIPFWANGSGFINKKRNRIFIFNEAAGTLTPLSDPLFEVAALAASDDYMIFAGESYDRKPRKRAQFYRYDLKSGECRCIHADQEYFVQNMENVGSRFVIVGSTFERFGVEENYCFYTIDPKSGKISLLADADIYINNSLGCDCRYGQTRSLKGSGDFLYFITTQAKTAELYRLSMDGEISPVITKEGSVDDFDVFGDTILLHGLYDMQPQELYQYSISQGALKQLSSFNTLALKDRYVAKPQPLIFHNHEVALDGWVLLPIDFGPDKTYPAVLSIHGGPRTIYGPTFYHEMQVLASAGFFVFFCNPEGSSGCGNVFGDLRGKYGTIDYEDIMKFTDVVLNAYPQIDKNRLGVIGGSYGGFMVNWIIGHTDRFAAAVSQRSISNWVSFCGYSDIGPWFGLDQQATTPYEDVAKMWWHSPLKYADHAVTPTLFIHSNEDYRCGMPEGIQMYTALMNQGVPSRFCYFKGENHELSRSGKPLHRIKRLTEIVSWLLQYTSAQ